MRRRIAGFMVAAALQGVALVLAHDLVFLARHGSRYGEALVHAGHGETWSAAVDTTLFLAAALMVVGLLRLAYLGFLARSAPARPPLRLRELARIWRRIGPRIATLTVVLLTVQENIERASLTGSPPGPGILLSAEYAGGLWIAIAVGLLVGLVAALFEWRRRALEARLRAARAALPRHIALAGPRPRTATLLPSESILGRRSGLRAPPLPTTV